MSFLRRLEKSLDNRMRGIFGGAAPGGREAIELYRDAIDQISARATVSKRGDRVFPFERIRIELRAGDAERRTVLEAIFDNMQTLEDVRAALLEVRAETPADLAVEIEYLTEAAAEMRVLCEKAPAAVPAAPAAPASLRPMRLMTLAGVSTAPEFIAQKPNINIGRVDEVVDQLGRAVRRNDLCFPENDHEANSSVSRAHAHLRFDGNADEWRIYDDGSSLGTSIFRDGRRIDVPPHAARGVLLRSGDEIYIGQARLRFDQA